MHTRLPLLLRRGVRALMLFLDLYALVMLVYLLARLGVGERWELIELGNSLMPALLYPAPVALALLLLAKRARLARWMEVALPLPALIAFALLYGGQFVPRALSAPGDAETLTVLTYNMRRQLEHAPVKAEIIRASGADVVALQELTTPMARELIPLLGDIYPYTLLHPSPDTAKGQGILSRYPLDEGIMWERRFYNQRARVMLNSGVSITVYNLHLSPPNLWRGGGGFDTSARRDELQFFLDDAAGQETPIIFAGDFNMTDQTVDYARIASRYIDTYRAAGWGLGTTFPNPAYSNLPLRRLVSGLLPPLIRIDYIFHSDHFTTLEARVWESSGASDHYPVVARLTLP